MFLVPPQLVATPNVITVANKAEALASYAKQAKDESMHKMAERIQARAIRRCGELLKQIEPGKTGPKQLGAGAHTQLSRKDAATEAGLSKHQQVQAMRVYARQARNKNLEVDAAEIRLRAERRLGELIAAQKATVGLNTGRAGKGRPRLGGSLSEPPKDSIPTLAEAGIDKKLSSRAQELAAVPQRIVSPGASWRIEILSVALQGPWENRAHGAG